MNAHKPPLDEQWAIEIFSGQLDVPHAAHPSFSSLHGVANGTLEPAWHDRVRLHVATCARCALEVQQLLEAQELPDAWMRGLAFGPEASLRGPVLSKPRAPAPGIGQQMVHLFQRLSLGRHALVYAAAMLLVAAYAVLDGWVFVRPRMLTVSHPTSTLTQVLRWGLVALGLTWSAVLGLHALIVWRRR